MGQTIFFASCGLARWVAGGDVVVVGGVVFVFDIGGSWGAGAEAGCSGSRGGIWI